MQDDHENDAADLLDQSCTPRLREISPRRTGHLLTALTIAAEGGKADIAKPFIGLGSGVFEIALPLRGNAFRVVYAVQIAEAIWVLHAFQKKSTKGIKTPKPDMDIVESRLRALKEMLR